MLMQFFWGGGEEGWGRVNEVSLGNVKMVNDAEIWSVWFPGRDGIKMEGDNNKDAI